MPGEGGKGRRPVGEKKLGQKEKVGQQGKTTWDGGRGRKPVSKIREPRAERER